MENAAAGFREIEHSADWQLHVWGPDIQSLFEQAARGMYALSGARWLSPSTEKRQVDLTALDHETLLVSFLSELLCIYEQERLGFNQFDLHVGANSLQAALLGANISAFEKEIKAVTYHNLFIRRTARGYEVNIVFDV